MELNNFSNEGVIKWMPSSKIRFFPSKKNNLVAKNMISLKSKTYKLAPKLPEYFLKDYTLNKKSIFELLKNTPYTLKKMIQPSKLSPISLTPVPEISQNKFISKTSFKVNFSFELPKKTSSKTQSKGIKLKKKLVPLNKSLEIKSTSILKPIILSSVLSRKSLNKKIRPAFEHSHNTPKPVEDVNINTDSLYEEDWLISKY